jgi:hypothetical protein
LDFLGIQVGVAIIVNDLDGMLEGEIYWEDLLTARTENQKFTCLRFPSTNDLNASFSEFFFFQYRTEAHRLGSDFGNDSNLILGRIRGSRHKVYRDLNSDDSGLWVKGRAVNELAPEIQGRAGG